MTTARERDWSKEAYFMCFSCDQAEATDERQVHRAEELRLVDGEPWCQSCYECGTDYETPWESQPAFAPFAVLQAALDEWRIAGTAVSAYGECTPDYLDKFQPEELAASIRRIGNRAETAEAALDEAVRERDDLRARKAYTELVNAQALIDQWHDRAKVAESRLRAYESGDASSCTCHPDDNPPIPCPKRYALTECREAAATLTPSGDAGELVKELEEDAEYIESYDGFIGSQLRIAHHQRQAADEIAALQAALDEAEAKLQVSYSLTSTIRDKHLATLAALDEAVRDHRAAVNRAIVANSERDEARQEALAAGNVADELSYEIETLRSRLRAYESGDAGELVAELEDEARSHTDETGISATGALYLKAATALRAADARERKAVEALEPFAHAVFNDNGDCTVDRSVADHDDFIRAYFVHRRLIRAHTATGGEG